MNDAQVCKEDPEEPKRKKERIYRERRISFAYSYRSKKRPYFNVFLFDGGKGCSGWNDNRSVYYGVGIEMRVSSSVKEKKAKKKVVRFPLLKRRMTCAEQWNRGGPRLTVRKC